MLYVKLTPSDVACVDFNYICSLETVYFTLSLFCFFSCEYIKEVYMHILQFLQVVQLSLIHSPIQYFDQC